jgi:hypothetical protein
MSTYSQWEEHVTQCIADELEISFSDAAGIVEGQDFYMTQSWGMALDASATAAKIIAAAIS